MALEKPFLWACCLMTLMSHTSWKQKKGRCESSQFQQSGGCEWSSEACLREEHCQWLGNRSTLVSEGQPSAAGDAANTCSLSVGEHKWSHAHKNVEEEQRQLLSTHLDFFAGSCIRQHSSHHKIMLFSLLLWFTIAPTVNYRLIESFKVEKTSKTKSNH